jgi:hypothetical protein
LSRAYDLYCEIEDIGKAVELFNYFNGIFSRYQREKTILAKHPNTFLDMGYHWCRWGLTAGIDT